MPLLTTPEVKALIGIANSDTTYDTDIDSLLPSAIDKLFNVTCNYFELYPDEINIESDTISFSAADKKINDTGNGFVDAGFVDGIFVRIYNSLLNDGVYKTLSISADSITLDQSETIKDESAGRKVKITMVKLPQEAKLFIAQVVEFNLAKKARREGIESERFDDYNVRYADQSKGLPERILQNIERFKKLKWD